MTEPNEMDIEELTMYITTLLESTLVEKFNYEVIKEKETLITKTYFKTSSGWEIKKEDRWKE